MGLRGVWPLVGFFQHLAAFAGLLGIIGSLAALGNEPQIRVMRGASKPSFVSARREITPLLSASTPVVDGSLLERPIVQSADETSHRIPATINHEPAMLPPSRWHELTKHTSSSIARDDNQFHLESRPEWTTLPETNSKSADGQSLETPWKTPAGADVPPNALSPVQTASGQIQTGDGRFQGESMPQAAGFFETIPAGTSGQQKPQATAIDSAEDRLPPPDPVRDVEATVASVVGSVPAFNKGTLSEGDQLRSADEGPLEQNLADGISSAGQVPADARTPGDGQLADDVEQIESRRQDSGHADSGALGRLLTSESLILAFMGMLLGVCLMVGARATASKPRAGDSVLQVRIVGSESALFTLQTCGESHHVAAAPVPNQNMPASDPQRVPMADFSEGSHDMLLALGPSWEDQRQSREAERAELERAILQQIFEDNADLKTQLFQSQGAA